MWKERIKIFQNKTGIIWQSLIIDVSLGNADHENNMQYTSI